MSADSKSQSKKVRRCAAVHSMLGVLLVTLGVACGSPESATSPIQPSGIKASVVTPAVGVRDIVATPTHVYYSDLEGIADAQLGVVYEGTVHSRISERDDHVFVVASPTPDIDDVGSAMLAIPSSGGNPAILGPEWQAESVATSKLGVLFVDGGTALIFQNEGPDWTQAKLHEIPIGPSTVMTLDDDALYWIAGGSLSRLRNPFNGARAPEFLASVDAGTTQLRAFGDGVYGLVPGPNGIVWSVPKDGGSKTVLVESADSFCVEDTGLAADADGVVFVATWSGHGESASLDCGTNTAPVRVETGSKRIRALAEPTSVKEYLSGLAVADGSVYYFVGEWGPSLMGAIRRTASE